MTFEHPLAFLLLLLVPLLYLLRHFSIFSAISFPLILGDWQGKSFEWKQGLRRFLNAFIQFLMIASYVCAVVAFAAPVLSRQEKMYTSRGADILFVIDSSPSMAAKDIAGMTRLDAAKQAVRTLIDRNEGASIGLVGMAKEAAVIVPPTMDHDLLYKRLDTFGVGVLGDGTAIGTGLSCAVFHLSDSNAPKKSIVLITDGENNAGSIHPHTAAHLAKEKGINLYVLGIGTKGTVPLEYVDPVTNKVYSGYLDSQYDERALSQIAFEADGQFYSVETLSSLSQALLAISKNEVVAQSFQIKSTKAMYYWQFLILALVLAFFVFFLRRVALKEIL